MKKLDIRCNPGGSYKFRCTLWFGKKRKGIRKTFGLHTYDFAEAERRAFLLVRVFKNLRIWNPGQVPSKTNITLASLEKASQLALFKRENQEPKPEVDNIPHEPEN